MRFTPFAPFLGLVLFVQASSALATVSTFEEFSLPAESHYFPAVTTSFSSGAASFNHHYDAAFGSWDGFIYSNRTDNTTAGWDNQFSAFTGSGFAGSANYGLGYVSSFSGVLPTVSFANPTLLEGAYFSNTTYTALSIRDGDMFSKKFGGDTGNDADWLKLVITGLDATGSSTGSLAFYLADYRFTDNTQDYIVSDWRYVDLSGLGAVAALQFTMESSDVGMFGINTPTYFALDNLSISAVPESSTLAMLLAGLGLLSFNLRQRRSS